MGTEIVALDVAHGNSTLITRNSHSVLIDAPAGALVGEVLHELGVSKLDSIVISHADTDHMGGVANLLLDERLQIENIYLNSDATKTQSVPGRAWTHLALALADSMTRGATNVDVGVKRGDSIAIGDPAVRIEVLAPTLELVILAAGGRDEDGHTIDSNTVSIVVRVWSDDEPFALVPGDLDALGLQHLMDCGGDLNAEVLIFPHHGGGSGGDNTDFASRLCDAVAPNRVVFSHGRSTRWMNPLPEIMAGVRASRPDAKVSCTQLSRRCSELPISSPFSGDPLAAGASSGSCCAGSIVFSSTGGISPLDDDHDQFVRDNVPTPLCFEPQI